MSPSTMVGYLTYLDVYIYVTGTLSGVMVNKLDDQPFTSVYEFHWMAHFYTSKKKA